MTAKNSTYLEIGTNYREFQFINYQPKPDKLIDSELLLALLLFPSNQQPEMLALLKENPSDNLSSIPGVHQG